MNATPVATDPIWTHPTYLIRRQFLKLLGANFRVFDPAGNLVMFSNQKAFRLREDIRVYADEGRSHELLTIRARQILDFSAAYDVFDARTGEKVGAFKRKGWKSMVRDAWIVLDSRDQEIGKIEEEHIALALIRRFLAELIPQSFQVQIHGRKAAEFRQAFNPFLYTLTVDFARGVQVGIDRRLGLAGAILITAIEGRQG